MRQKTAIVHIVMLNIIASLSVNQRGQSVTALQLLAYNNYGIPHWLRNSSAIDPCASAPCLNAGTCLGTPQHKPPYRCQCVPGYTGTVCDKGLDECIGNPCVNGACVDNIGSFRCHCYPGFTGELCDTDVDECQSSPCQNGGSCYQPVPGVYACQCPRGYRGYRCQTDIDECLALSPCQNGGLCRQGPPGNYLCTCLPGFTGNDCQFKTPECSSKPCQNGGRCEEGEGFQSLRCICNQGFTGRLCENEVIDNVCTRNSSLCGQQQQGHQCIPSIRDAEIGGYRCLCADGTMTTNRSCRDGAGNGHGGGSVMTPDPCKSSPCQNGGHCGKGPQGSYRCMCRCGYSGAVCQITSRNFNQTDNSRCRNGGLCFQQQNGLIRCNCPTTYTGSTCEIPVDPCASGSNPCLNNGMCTFSQTYGNIQCRCHNGFMGDLCQFQDVNATTNANTSTTTTTTNSSTRGFPLNRSGVDPTLLIVILGIMGTVAIFVGVPMLYFYFYRRNKRPRDFCMSVPEPKSRHFLRPDADTTYSTWIANDVINFDSKYSSPPSSITPPLNSFYFSSSQRQF